MRNYAFFICLEFLDKILSYAQLNESACVH